MGKQRQLEVESFTDLWWKLVYEAYDEFKEIRDPMVPGMNGQQVLGCYWQATDKMGWFPEQEIKTYVV